MSAAATNRWLSLTAPLSSSISGPHGVHLAYANCPCWTRGTVAVNNDGTAVLAIAIDADTDAVIGFAEDLALTLPVWIAFPGKVDVSTHFGNHRSVLPFSVLLGADGRVLAQRAGELDEKLLRQWAELAKSAATP